MSSGTIVCLLCVCLVRLGLVSFLCPMSFDIRDKESEIEAAKSDTRQLHAQVAELEQKVSIMNKITS